MNWILRKCPEIEIYYCLLHCPIEHNPCILNTKYECHCYLFIYHQINTNFFEVLVFSKSWMIHQTIGSYLIKERGITINRMNKQIIELITPFFTLICCFSYDKQNQIKNIFFRFLLNCYQSIYSIRFYLLLYA